MYVRNLPPPPILSCLQRASVLTLGLLLLPVGSQYCTIFVKSQSGKRSMNQVTNIPTSTGRNFNSMYHGKGIEQRKNEKKRKR